MITYSMTQMLCIKCGSDLKASSYCHLCQQPLIFTCTSCNYITEEKVHTDCRNAQVLAKTEATTTKEEGAATSTTTLSATTGNQEESTVDKLKEEQTVKTELPSVQQDNNKNNNINLFAAGTGVWQSLMTYWLNTYGEFFKNALKTTEDWYNIFYKPWLNWMPQRRSRKIDID